MNKSWQTVRLGEVLKRVKDEVAIQDDEVYTRLTIRMNGKGIVPRDQVPGHEIGTKKQFMARGGQLVLSKIDARNGAFGILPSRCDNAIITGNFWAFDANGQRVFAAYLEYLTRTPLFVDFCIRASEGTTNRRYLQEDRFLAQEVALPSVKEQRQIVARIEELSAHITEARTLRQQAAEQAGALLPSQTNALFTHLARGPWQTKPLGEAAEIRSGVTLGRRLAGKTVRLPYLRVANVQDGRLDLSRMKEVEILESETEKWKLRAGDMLLTEGGDWDKLGRGAVWNDEIPDCIHQNHIFCVRTSAEQFVPEFLAQFIGSPVGKAYFQGASKQTTNLASINQRQLKAFPVVVPPLHEQRRAVGELDALQAEVDALKRLQAESAAELDALFSSILDRAFKGEL